MSSSIPVPKTISVMKSPEFLIQDILPSQEVHLLGGPSGAGKTTWLFQMLHDQWKLGGTILGKAVFPVPYVYISADRSNKGVKRTMFRAGINNEAVAFMSLMNFPDVRTVPQAIDKVLLVKPEAKLFFIDGCMGLIPPRRDNSSDGGFKHISMFLADLCRLCQSKDITMVLIVHSPKQKEDSRYTNPRERVMGSAAWAAFTETVILMEPMQPISKETAHCRTLICLPRNAAASFTDWEFNSRGRLVERSDEVEDTIIGAWLDSLPYPGSFTTDQFFAVMEKSMSRATIYRWLERLVKDKDLVHDKKGHWTYVREWPDHPSPEGSRSK